jgi:hypothetical protein
MELSFSASHAIFVTYNNWWDLGKYQNHCLLPLIKLKKKKKKQDKAQINIY